MGVCKGGAGLGRPIKLDKHVRPALGVGACMHVCVCQVCACLRDPVNGHAMFKEPLQVRHPSLGIGVA